MASGSDFMIRCKTQDGSFILRSVDSESTVQELKMQLSKETNMKPECIKILCGYPPRALPAGKDSAKLKDVNIHSGETIIIERMSPVQVSEEKQPDPDSASAVLGDTGEAIEASFGHVNPSSVTAPFLDELAGGIMLRRVVPSNNSCLFTSVYFSLSNGDFNEEKSNELRGLIAHIVSSNKEKYNDAFLGIANDKYCKWIQHSHTWGGAIELSILSEHFGVEIVAVDTINLTMHRFGEEANYANRIILLYDGIHYDPLIVEMDNAAQTVFPVSDDRPTEMAMEVAREAKSSRQFTDVHNFSLRCMVCDIKLRGDREARDHAVSTGHNQFGEITN